MAIYFGSHGQTEAVAQGLCAGRKSETALTPQGEREAIALGEAAQEIGVTSIVASASGPARQAAHLVGSKLGITPMHMHASMDLEEYFMGQLEGEPMPVGQDASAAFREARAESPWLFAHRIVRVLELEHRYHDSYGATHQSPETLLIGHPGVSRMIETLANGQSPVTFYDVEPAPPTIIRELNVPDISRVFETLYLEATLHQA
jgi:broad specificity phosphatase PhoE